MRQGNHGVYGVRAFKSVPYLTQRTHYLPERQFYIDYGNVMRVFIWNQDIASDNGPDWIDVEWDVDPADASD